MDRGIITISETGAVTMPTTPVWMTLFEIADLFGVFSSDVRKIIRSAYKSRELDEQITMRYIKNGNRMLRENKNINYLLLGLNEKNGSFSNPS